MAEQYSPAVPQKDRRNGWLYDADSGVLVGLASDEMRKKHPAMVPFNHVIGGCPHRVVIHMTEENRP